MSASSKPGWYCGSLPVRAVERRQVASGGPAGDGDEVRIDAVLVGVLAHPGDRPLHVDEVVGKRRHRAEAVVDVEAHPAPLGESLHEQLTLAVLKADHPATAVDLDERRSALARRWRCGRLVDVEAQRPTTGPPEDDVAPHPHRGELALGRLVGQLAQGIADLVPGAVAPADRHGEAGPRRQRDGQADLARPRPQAAPRSEQRGGNHLPQQVERRQLDGHPRGEEAPPVQHPAPLRGAEGRERVGRAVDADREVDPAHQATVARRGRAVNCRSPPSGAVGHCTTSAVLTIRGAE